MLMKISVSTTKLGIVLDDESLRNFNYSAIFSDMDLVCSLRFFFSNILGIVFKNDYIGRATFSRIYHCIFLIFR